MLKPNSRAKSAAPAALVRVRCSALPASSLAAQFEAAWAAQRRFAVREGQSAVDTAAAETAWDLADARTREVVERLLARPVRSVADAKAMARAFCWCFGDHIERTLDMFAHGSTDRRALHALLRFLVEA